MYSSAQNQSDEFEAAVLECFEFLESKYGFLRRSFHPQKYTHLVMYENSELYVVLSYGPPAYEPEMSFGRHGVDDVSGGHDFHSGDLVLLDCCHNWVWNSDKSSYLKSWIAELARLLSICGVKCLAGDQAVFSQMKSRRDKLVSDWVNSEKLREVRNQIDLAWRGKDYKQILCLYKAVENLTELDKRRIAFAASHAKNESTPDK